MTDHRHRNRQRRRRVAGVEVSTDGGTTGIRRPGRRVWTYTWTPGGYGTTTISVTRRRRQRQPRDARGRRDHRGSVTLPLHASGARRHARSRPSPQTDTSRGRARRQVHAPTSAGFITGIRFYKGAGNTGTHVGSLWTRGGTLLARATFTGETRDRLAAGELRHARSPSAPNTTYVASYYAPNGHYAVDLGYFTYTRTCNGPLQRPAATAPTEPTASTATAPQRLPDQTLRSHATTGSTSSSTTGAGRHHRARLITRTSPVPSATDAGDQRDVTATFSEALDAGVGHGVSTFRSATAPARSSQLRSPRTRPRRAHADPAAAGGRHAAYTATVQGGASGIADSHGNHARGEPHAGPSPTGRRRATARARLWHAAANRAVGRLGRHERVELGVKFRADVAGLHHRRPLLQGRRQHRHPRRQPVDAHRHGSRPSPSPARPPAAGSRQLRAPGRGQRQHDLRRVLLRPDGHYARQRRLLHHGDVRDGPLHGAGERHRRANGVYATAPRGFPTNSLQRSNYWVDVVFARRAPTPRRRRSSSVTAAGDQRRRHRPTVTATFSERSTRHRRARRPARPAARSSGSVACDASPGARP